MMIYCSLCGKETNIHVSNEISVMTTFEKLKCEYCLATIDVLIAYPFRINVSSKNYSESDNYNEVFLYTEIE